MNDQLLQQALSIDATAEPSPAVAPGRVPVTARLAPRPIYVLRFGDGVASPEAGAMIARASAGGGHALPDDVRARFESSTGHDLSGVRVHTGGDSAAAAGAIGARAYTVGQDIHFADGQYRPADPFGLHLIAHEVVHTVQQAGGAAGPAPQPALAVSQPGDAFEVEAEALAPSLVRGEPVSVAGVSAGVARTIMRAGDGSGPATSGIKGKFVVEKTTLARGIKFGPLTGDASQSLEISYEAVKKDPPADGGSTTAKPGGTAPESVPSQTDKRVGPAGDAPKGAVGITVEQKNEIDQGTRSKILGVKASHKETVELTTKSGKVGGSFNLETSIGDVPLNLKVIEFNIIKWDATNKEKPVQIAVATVGVEAQIAEFQHTTADGQVFKVKPTAKIEFEFKPDPATIGRFIAENMAKVFATEVGLAGSFIAGGALTIGFALYQIATSVRSPSAPRARSASAAATAAPSRPRSRAAPRRPAATAPPRAPRPARRGSTRASSSGPTASTAWRWRRRARTCTSRRGRRRGRIRAKAIADYWADHKAEHFVYGDEGAGNGGFRTFLRVLDAAGGT